MGVAWRSQWCRTGRAAASNSLNDSHPGPTTTRLRQRRSGRSRSVAPRREFTSRHRPRLVRDATRCRVDPRRLDELVDPTLLETDDPAELVGGSYEAAAILSPPSLPRRSRAAILGMVGV